MSNQALPTVFAMEKITMGIGVAIVALTVPAEATHIISHPAAGEFSQTMLLHMTATGFANAPGLTLSFTGASGAVPFYPGPVHIPRNALITAYSLRRIATGGAVDYAVYYLK
jgi:hypothetical protein